MKNLRRLRQFFWRERLRVDVSQYESHQVGGRLKIVECLVQNGLQSGVGVL